MNLLNIGLTFDADLSKGRTMKTQSVTKAGAMAPKHPYLVDVLNRKQKRQVDILIVLWAAGQREGARLGECLFRTGALALGCVGSYRCLSSND